MIDKKEIILAGGIVFKASLIKTFFDLYPVDSNNAISFTKDRNPP